MASALAHLHPRHWLAHPLTRGYDLDDPQTTQLRRQIIAHKPFLRRIYREWYALLAAALLADAAPLLEIGAGAGFLSQHLPGLLSSDIFRCEVDAVLDGQQLPLAAASLRGIMMTNVLHHLPQPRRFFAEATRTVQPAGRLLLIEPWVSRWSALVYRSLHHEPFDPQAACWELPAGGPLSAANGAQAWIIFQRDAAVFAHEFPAWRVIEIRPLMPVRYLLSGGVSLRTLVPNWSYPLWVRFEQALQPWMRHWAMFALIVLERQP